MHHTHLQLETLTQRIATGQSGNPNLILVSHRFLHNAFAGSTRLGFSSVEHASKSRTLLEGPKVWATVSAHVVRGDERDRSLTYIDEFLVTHLGSFKAAFKMGMSHL